MSDIEREVLEVDVLVVGAGPAGLAAAWRLGQLIEQERQSGRSREFSIAVLEKGAELGSHALSGAVFDPRALRELAPEDWQDAPLEAPVGRERVLWLGRRRALPFPIIPPPLRNHGCYVTSLGRLVQWMGARVEALGIDVFCEFSGSELLYEDQRVVGVRTGDRGLDHEGRPKANFEPGVDIRARVVLLAEGPRGTLARQLEGRLGLTEGRNPQTYAIGLKETWQLPAGRLAAGDVVHTLGWPLDNSVYGGGFLYGMQEDQAIVGLVVGLDYADPRLDPHDRFQRFKTHPAIRPYLEGGELIGYGAKAIPEGGWWAMPRLYGDGFLILGDSGSLLNSQRLKGIHLAMKSGMLAAESAFEALLADDPSAARLAAYEQRIAGSWIREELWPVRNFHQAFEHGTWAGMLQAALGLVTGGRGWGFRQRLACRPGHERMERLPEGTVPTAPPSRPDGQLTFDRLADVFQSGTAHREDQPVHLLVADLDICHDRCVAEFDNPCQRFCPAAVYEMVADTTAPRGRRLQINASNCVHCKTCDIADPYQIITWVPPEGGGGPHYRRM